MIKMVGKTADGKTMMMFGLSRENCERLLKSQPIVVDGVELGLPEVRIIIFAGETEEDMTRDLMVHGLVAK